MIFVLFFFLRDRVRVLATVTRFLPLTGGEVDELFKVTADTVHATVYGTLGVALLQGTLGGLVFWWLGLPAPLLWGAVMAVLSVLAGARRRAGLGAGGGVPGAVGPVDRRDHPHAPSASSSSASSTTSSTR